MLNISLEIDLERSEPYRNRALQILLWTMIRLNELYIVTHRGVPRMYQSGVRYIAEPYGYEQWITIPKIRRQGGADCEDLCCWRVAELRVKGFEARPAWRHEDRRGPKGNFRMYHIGVFIPGFGFEDPSALLGMHDRNRPVLPYPSHWRRAA